MQKNMVETALGAVVICVAIGFSVFFASVAGVKDIDGYTLLARFSKVDGLAVGSPVRIGGVDVGKVLSLTLDPATYAAVVTMRLENTIRLPKDTSAIMTSAGLLDGKFLTLEPGGEEDMLSPGAEIQYTQSTPSLEQLLGQVIFSLTKKEETSDAPRPSPEQVLSGDGKAETP